MRVTPLFHTRMRTVTACLLATILQLQLQLRVSAHLMSWLDEAFSVQ